MEANLMGRIVIINDDNLMKNEWKMGRIIECYWGRSDEHIRSVDLKTTTGVIRRPVQQLSLLEADEEDVKDPVLLPHETISLEDKIRRRNS